ncbi:MAG: glycosyltransferase [Candidatus Bipolaricaulis sp.]|nr:glycosyltransferase [Candidatus Bipolaricaulis sp.]
MTLAGHEASLVVFLAILAALSAANLFGIHPLGSARHRKTAAHAQTPRVSVLVPARNEERGVAACLTSLLAQDYRDFEVLVLDDRSSDGTAAILHDLAATTPLRVLDGSPLPSGWLGKNWACHQLATAASGRLLLFVDADTRHHPRTLSDAVAALEAEHVDFLSVLSRQETRTWAERLVVPIVSWSQHTFFPVPILRRIRRPAFATAIGQFMLVRRDAYETLGGYERVRNSAVDDWDLVRAVVADGLRWTLCDGAARVTTRMYRSFGETVDGFSKNLYARFGYNLPFFTFVWAWLLWITWQPPVLLLLVALGVNWIPVAVVPYAAAAVGLNTLTWLASDLRFRVSPTHVLIYPLTVFAAFAIAVRSVLWHALGIGTWKDRPLHQKRHRRLRGHARTTSRRPRG